MKSLAKLTTATTLLFSIFIISCSDDIQEDVPNRSESQEIPNKAPNSKTSYTTLDLMAMAADIEEISYSSSADEYTITMYNSSNGYIVEVSSNTVSLVEFDILDGSDTKSVSIDNELETVDIDDESWSFSAYESYEVTSVSNELRNIATVMAPYIEISSQSSSIYTDNGSSDVFDLDQDGDDDENGDPGIFWGKKKTSEIGINMLACPGSVGTRKCYDIYRFFVKVGNECEDECL